MIYIQDMNENKWMVTEEIEGGEKMKINNGLAEEIVG